MGSGLCAGGGNGSVQRCPLETVGWRSDKDSSAVVRGTHSLCPGWI